MGLKRRRTKPGIPPAPKVPLVETPRCTSNPPCESRGLKPCAYCRIYRDGTRWWLKT